MRKGWSGNQVPPYPQGAEDNLNLSKISLLFIALFSKTNRQTGVRFSEIASINVNQRNSVSF